eukprot:69516_1
MDSKVPEPPPGQFYNCFGEPITLSDREYAFQFVDILNQSKITIDEMKSACKKFDLANPDELFAHLDPNNKGHVDKDDWDQALWKEELSGKNSKLTNFWHCVLGGKHLEELPRDTDFAIDKANKKLSSSTILALYSITRKMCMKLSKEEFCKLFKKCIDNVLAQLLHKRNYIVRETCICLSKIIIARGPQFFK